MERENFLIGKWVPLKQGLKLLADAKDAFLKNIGKWVPLKQGLKLTNWNKYQFSKRIGKWVPLKQGLKRKFDKQKDPWQAR